MAAGTTQNNILNRIKSRKLFVLLLSCFFLLTHAVAQQRKRIAHITTTDNFKKKNFGKHENRDLAKISGKGAQSTLAPSTPPSEPPSPQPSEPPQPLPTLSPTTSSPSSKPTLQATPQPSAPPSTLAPIPNPTLKPSSKPTTNPTPDPTLQPSGAPVSGPTPFPSASPSSLSVSASILRTQVLDALQPYVLNFEAFSVSNSYQSKALNEILKRLQALNNRSILRDNPQKLVQLFTCLCIFKATNAVANEFTPPQNIFRNFDWKSRKGWEDMTTAAMTLSSTRSSEFYDYSLLDPCIDWHGITCNTDGYITKIALQRNNLSGIFPNEIILLSSKNSINDDKITGGNLTELELYNNEYLTNNDSNSWIPFLGDDLEILNYAFTSFKGSLPDILPTNIVEFDCSNTRHTGPLPNYHSYKSLRALFLDGNDYQSAVPTSFSTLDNLQFLFLRNAGLIGDLSFLKTGMSTIVEILLNDNPQLTGSLTAIFDETDNGHLSTLRSFSVANCNVIGSIPQQLPQGLVQLWLHGNKGLTGTIPPTLGHLDDLRILTLHDTDNVYGDMPIDVCLSQLNGNLMTLAADCNSNVNCHSYYPECCTCCGIEECGS